MTPDDFTPASLRTLRVLLEERNLTRAANRLRVTPSAVSRILGRLRTAFDDPLLVRTSSGLALTDGARAIQPHLATVLDELERLIQPAATDPLKFLGTVKVGISRYAGGLEIERALPVLMKEAPGVSFRLRHLSAENLEEIETGGLDLAISLAKSSSPNLYRASVKTDRWVCMMRSGHPLAKSMTIEGYAAAQHLALTHAEDGRGPIDEVLDGFGARREITVSTLGSSSVAIILAQSDLVLTLPCWVAEPLARPPLIIADLPGFFPPVESTLYWHARVNHAPLLIWLRRRLMEVLRD
jgi:DNA-binding transcriptional LysR family regulator